jgi:hypothetical protein
MSWYITKTSILSSAVPTDGLMFYKDANQWSNRFEDRKLFDTRESAEEVVTEVRVYGTIIPSNLQFVEE